MRAFAFIFFAVGALDAWALLDARAVLRRSNRRLSTASFAQHKVTASDGAYADEFGYSVAIDGDTVVIGAPAKDSWTGAVYVLRTTDGGAKYDEVAKLTASDAAAWDYFGYSVAIQGGTVVVGTYHKEAAYVFRTTDGVTYDQVAKLTASDGAAYDYFGISMAIDGATIVIGTESGGAAYVFHTTDDWDTHTEIKLTAADTAAGDNFGYSVAIDGATVIVGANQYWNSGQGAVYVFRTSDGGATYAQVAKLTAADAAASDEFGYSVAIDGDTVVIGAPAKDSWTGAVYVLHTTDGGASYVEVAKLTASDAYSNDNLGISVAIDGTTIVAGAYGDDDAGSRSGSAYVFRMQDAVTVVKAGYIQVAKLTASDAAEWDRFGWSVAIEGDTIVVGAYYKDDQTGAAYVFSPPAPTAQPTPRPTWTFQPTPQPTMSPKPTPQPTTPQPTPQPTTPEPSVAALGSDSATRAGGTLLALVVTVLAL